MRKAVGRNVLRKEGREKVSGAARYIDDLSFPDLLHARTIRSTIPAGEISGISFNFDTAGFTIVDFRDVPAGPWSKYLAATADLYNLLSQLDAPVAAFAPRVFICESSDPLASLASNHLDALNHSGSDDMLYPEI